MPGNTTTKLGYGETELGWRLGLLKVPDLLFAYHHHLSLSRQFRRMGVASTSSRQAKNGNGQYLERRLGQQDGYDLAVVLYKGSH